MARVERAAGGVVWRRNDAGAMQIVMIRDRYGAWTLPKGHLEGDETEEQAALREIGEEAGIGGELGALVERITYRVQKRGLWRTKSVAFFLVRALNFELRPARDEGITAAEWVGLDQAVGRASYHQVADVIRRAAWMLE